MADKPILFSAPMVRALLEGRKTQTRRVLEDRNGITRSRSDALDLVRIRIGDRLWVKEAWRFEVDDNKLTPAQIIDIFADPECADPGEMPLVRYDANGAMNQSLPPHGFKPGRYRHGRFMPRALSRITLTVSDVRVQRLQDISTIDCTAEGVQPALADAMDRAGSSELDQRRAYHAAHVNAYRDIWNSINGKKHPWKSNPWVAAYTFTVALRKIDT